MHQLVKYQFKTVDELIEFYLSNYSKVIKSYMPESVYNFIVSEQLSLLQSILKSEYNEPSIHDLMLIREINRQRDIYQGSVYVGTLAAMKDIIEFYSNRK